MKFILWKMYRACYHLSEMFSRGQYQSLRLLDKIDRHYADKRWVEAMDKTNINKGVK